MNNCKPTYKRKRYDSDKAVLEAANKDSKYYNIDLAELAPKEQLRIIDNSENFDDIKKALEGSLHVQNLPIIYQEYYVRVINNIIMESGKKGLLLEKRNREYESATENKIKEVFKRNTQAFIDNQKNKRAVYKRVLDIHKTKGKEVARRELESYMEERNNKYINMAYYLTKDSFFPVQDLARELANIKNSLEIAEKGIEETDLLFKYAIHKIKSYSLVNIAKARKQKADKDAIDALLTEEEKKIERNNQEQEEEILEDGQNVRDSFQQERAFKLNGKDQLQAKVKMLLIGIQDASKAVKENGKYKTTNKSFMGSEMSVPFDIVYDKLVTIHALAYLNYSKKVVGQSKFNALMEELDEHVVNLPYLANVIKALRGTSKANQKAYVNNMAKAPINHRTFYSKKNKIQNKETKRTETRYNLSSSITNQSSNVYQLLDYFKNTFFDSSFVLGFEDDGTAIIDEEDAAAFFEQASLIDNHIKQYKKAFRLQETERVRKRKGELTQIDIKNIKDKADYPNNEIINYIDKAFTDLGFSFPLPFLRAFYVKPYFTKQIPINITELSSKKAGFFSVLKDAVLTKNGKAKHININTTSLFKDTYIKDFAKYVSKYSPELYASSYKTGEGNTVYGFSLPKFFTDRMKDLKTNPQLLKDISEDTFQGKHNILLDQLYDRNTGELKTNSKFFDFFEYSTVDSSVMIGSDQKGKALNKLSDVGIEQAKLTSFYNKGQKFADGEDYIVLNGKKYFFRNGSMFAPTMADKKTIHELTSMIYTVDLRGNKKMTKDHSIIDLILEEVVYPEYARIQKENFNNNVVNISEYKNSSSLFYFIPELNYVNNHILFETIGDDLPTTSSGNVSNKILKDIDTDAEVKTHLREAVFNHIERLKEEKLKFWIDSGIATKKRMNRIDYNYSKAGFDTSPDALAYEFVSNYLINNANFFKLFAGDPAQYYKTKRVKKSDGKVNTITDYVYEVNNLSNFNRQDYNEQIENRTKSVISDTMDNLIKRLAGIIAPGTAIIGEEGDRIKWAVGKDISGKGARSSNMTYYTKLFGKKKAEDFYGRMDRTDAMGYSTLEEWAYIEYDRGSISFKQYNSLVDSEKQDSLTTNQLLLIKKVLKNNLLNPYKPVYFNNFKDGKEFRTFYVKQSTLPLSRHLTEGLDLDVLRKSMIRDKVSNFVFGTGVKTGQPLELIDIFDKEGNIKQDLKFTVDTKEEGNGILGDFVIDSPRQGHKIQLDNPIHKEEVTDGSQHRNLIFADMLHITDFKNPFGEGTKSGQELRDTLQQKYSEIYKLQSEDLKSSLSYNEETGKIDLRKLRDLLVEEFEERSYPLSDLDYLGLIEDSTGKLVFKRPLWTSNLSSKIENVLVSLVNNRVRKLKATGHAFTLASNVGFKPKKLLEGTEAQKFIEKNKNSLLMDKEWAERGGYELKGQRTEIVNGKEVVLPAEIMIPSIFKNKQGEYIRLIDLTKDGYIDKESIPDELLEIFGYRIPTQSPNSMSYMKVVAFLPSTYSDLIVAPAEFTSQMGSDFDIDKLYTQIYAYESNEIEKIITKNGKEVTIKKTQLSRISPDTNKGEDSSKKKVHLLLNEALDIKFAVFKNTNDNVQTNILKPLDDNVFKDLSLEIEQDILNNTSFYSPFSDTAFRDKYLSGSVGQEAISFFARASIMISMLSNVDTNKHYIENSKGKPMFYTLGVDENDNIRKNNSLSNPSLSRTEYSKDNHTESRHTKATLASMLVSSSVDNANEQILGKLNINSLTYNFINGAIMSGFDAELIIATINQPIMLEYTRLLGKVKDTSVENYSYNNLLTDLYSKYGGMLNDPKEIMKKRKEKGNKSKYIAPTDFFGELNYKEEAFNFTTADLRKNIKNSNKLLNGKGESTTEQFKRQQTAVLAKFLQGERSFSPISRLQEATNIEGSKGYGKSLLYMHEKEQQIREIPYLNISNSIELLGTPEIIPQGLITEDKRKMLKEQGYVYLTKDNNYVYYVKPNTIVGSLATEGLFLATKMFTSDGSMFLYNHPVFSILLQKAYDYMKTPFSEDNLTARIELKQFSGNYARQFLYSELFNDLYKDSVYEERKRILISTDERPSFVKILTEVKKEHYNKYNANFLLQRLTLITKTPSKLDKIEFDGTKEGVELDFTGDAFLALAQDNSIWYNKDGIIYRGVDIAADLLKYQYVTGGVQFKKEFIKHLPAEIFESLGINEKLRDFSSFKEISDKYTEEIESYSKAFEIQMAQHKYDKIKAEISGDNFDESTQTIILDKKVQNKGEKEEKGKTKSNLLVVKAKVFGTDTVEFYLAEETDTKLIYKYLPRAGEGTFTEFDSEVHVITSVIPGNDRIQTVLDRREAFNIKKLKEYLDSDALWEHENGRQTRGTIAEYEKDKKIYAEDVRLVHTKDASNNLVVFSTEEFKGLFAFPKNLDITFSDELVEGEDYLLTDNEEVLNVEEEQEPVQPKNLNANEKAFYDKYNFLDSTSTLQGLINITRTLQRGTKDVTKKYLYELLLDAFPKLVAENPNMKIIVSENISGNGFVHLNDKGEITAIAYNPRILSYSSPAFIEKLILEELLHAVTLTKSSKENKVFKELSLLREQVLKELEENHKEEYDNFLEFSDKLAERKAVYQMLTPTTTFDALDIILKKQPYSIKHTKAYKNLRRKLTKANKEGTTFDVQEERKKLLDKYKLDKKDYDKYYGLTSTAEFITSMITSTPFQERLNRMKTPQKLSVLERFIALVVKALRRIGIGNISKGRAKSEDTFFKQGIAQNSVLEIGVAKTILLAKTFKKTKFAATEKKTIKEYVNILEERKEIFINPSYLNDAFGLTEGKSLSYIENPSTLVNQLTSIFGNIEAQVINGHYIHVYNKGFKPDISDLMLAPKDLEGDYIKAIRSKDDRVSDFRTLNELYQELDAIERANENKEDIEILKVAEEIKGTLSKESAEKETGLKVGNNKDISPAYISEEGMTIEKASENFSLTNSEYFRDLIIEILSAGTLTSLREDILGTERKKEVRREIRAIEARRENDPYSSDIAYNLSEEGEILPTEKRVNRLKNLKYKNIVQLQKIIRETKNAEKTPENKQKEIYFSLLLDAMKDSKNTKAIEDLNTLGDLLDLAKDQLESIKDLLGKESFLTESELMYARTILKNWENVFSLYFTKNEYRSYLEAVNNFNEIIRDSKLLLDEVNSKMVTLTENKINDGREEAIDLVKSLDEVTDSSWGEANNYDISRYGNPLLSYIHKRNKDSSNETKRESYDETKKLKEKLTRAIPALKKYEGDGNGIFNILFQKYEDGTLSGDLISPFSKSFIDEKNSLFQNFNELDKENRNKRYKKINKWYKQNTLTFSPHLIYRENKTEEEKKETKAHIDELVDILGQPLYNYFKEELTKKQQKYDEDYNRYIDYLMYEYKIATKEDFEKHTTAKGKLRLWEIKNSVEFYHKQKETGKPTEVGIKKGNTVTTETIYNEGHKYTISIPKRQINKGRGLEDSKYYDKNFDIILQEPAIKDFYDYYTDTLENLKKYLPPSAKESLKLNSLPFIEKTFLENITESGFSDIFSTLKKTFIGATDEVKKGLRAIDTSVENRETNDPNTSKPNRTLDYNLFSNHKKAWETYYNIAKAKYMAENNGYIPPLSFDKKIRKEFDNSIAERNTKDLGKLLKAYIGLSLTFKQKSKVQDTLLIGEILLETIEEKEKNHENKNFLDKAQEKVFKNKVHSLENLKKSLSHYVDVFHGKARKVQGEQELKILTSVEKRTKKDLETLIQTYETNIEEAKQKRKEGKLSEVELRKKITIRREQIKEAQENIDGLGGNFALSRGGDMILKFFQLKGMGWNVLAALNNIGFGVLGNMVEAEDGRVINKEEMEEAYKLVLNSVGRNISFNKWEGVKGTALKIRNLMDRNDILETAAHELYTNSIKGRAEIKKQTLLPFNLTKRSEYVNQAPIMVAMYKKTKHKYEDGKFVDLYSAHTKEGVWNTKEYGKEPVDLINTTSTKVAQLIKIIHGNYDPLAPLRVKDTIQGRAIVMFRTWFFEAYTQRWGDSVQDEILGIELKGRYRSFNELSRGKGQIHYVKQIASLFKDAVLRSFGKRKNYENITDVAVDSANMRKLTRELSYYLNLMAFVLALGMLRGDDEDESDQHAINLTLNLVNRVASELTLFANPQEFVRMAKNPAPAISIVSDVGRIISAFQHFMIGEDEIETGRYAGESRGKNALKRALPLLAPMRAIETSSKEEFNTPFMVELIEMLSEDDE